MGDTIIVGVDGSETALKAAQVAARLAVQAGVPLHIVSAYGEDGVEVIQVGSEEIRFSESGEALGVAEGVANQVRDGLKGITTSALEGNPADVILAEAERIDAGLIVVGNRRMQGLGRVLGSIASSVAHHASCDVYIVKTV